MQRNRIHWLKQALCAATLGIVLSGAPAWAQEPPAAALDDGTSGTTKKSPADEAACIVLDYLYKQQLFDEYLAQLAKLDFPNSTLSDVQKAYYSEYLAGRANRRVGQHREAAELLLKYKESQPGSQFAWRAHYLAVDCLEMLADWPRYNLETENFLKVHAAAPAMYRERLINARARTLVRQKDGPTMIAALQVILDNKLTHKSRETWTRYSIADHELSQVRPRGHQLTATEREAMKQTDAYKKLQVIRDDCAVRLKSEEDPMICYQYEKQWIGSYLHTEEYGQCEALAIKIISEKREHDKGWGFAMLYLGFAKQLNPHGTDFAGALKAFEAVMREPVVEDEEGDWTRRGVAATWAALLRSGKGDAATRARIKDYIEKELPHDYYRATALNTLKD